MLNALARAAVVAAVLSAVVPARAEEPLRNAVLVVPPQSDPDAAASDAPLGLVLGSVLENVLTLHPGLDECWFSWYERKLFPDAGGLERWLRGGAAPDAAPLGLRHVVTGRWARRGGALEVAFELHDRQRDLRFRRTVPVDLPGLAAFRSGFLALLEQAGIAGAPAVQQRAMAWAEDLPEEALAPLAEARLGAFAARLAGAPVADAVVSAAEEAARRAPRSYVAQNALAWTLFGAKRSDAAAAACERALALNSAGVDAAAGLLVRARDVGDDAGVERWTVRCSELQGRDPRPGLATVWGQRAAAEQDAGRPGAAKAYLERQLALVRELKDRTGEAGALNLLGILEFVAGRYAEAAPAFEAAAAIWRALGNGASEAVVRASLGRAHCGASRWEEGTRELGAARALARDAGDAAQERAALGFLASCQEAAKRWDAAVETHRAALALDRAAGRQADAAATLIAIGEALRAKGTPADAVAPYEEALALRRALKDRAGEASVHQRLGHARFEASRWDDAVQAYQASLAIWRELGRKAEAATVLVSLGKAQLDADRPAEAAASLEAAAALWRAEGVKEREALALRWLSVAQHRQRRTDDAVRTREMSLALAREAKDRRGEAADLQALESLHRSAGRVEDSRRYLREWLAAVRELGAEQDAKALAEVAEALARAGRPDDADACCEELVALRRKAGGAAGAAAAAAEAAAALTGHPPSSKESAGERAVWAAAVAWARRAVALQRQARNLPGEAHALETLAFAQHDAGLAGEAITTLDAAVELWRKLRRRDEEATALLMGDEVLRRRDERRVAALERVLAMTPEPKVVRSLEADRRLRSVPHGSAWATADHRLSVLLLGLPQARAVSRAERLLATARRGSVPQREGLAARRLAAVRLRANPYGAFISRFSLEDRADRAAVAPLRAAAEAFHAAGDAAREAAALYDLAAVKAHLGDADAALFKARALAIGSAWREPLGMFLGRGFQESLVLHDLQGSDAAVAYLELARVAGDEDQVAWVQCVSADAFIRASRYDDAVRGYEACLASARKSHKGDAATEARYLHQLGTIYGRMFFFERAIPLLEQALALRRAGMTLANLGYCHAWLGHHEQARRYAEEALAQKEPFGNDFKDGFALTVLGSAHRGLGRLDQAIALGEQGAATFRKHGTRKNANEQVKEAEAISLYFLAASYRAARRPADAYAALDRAVGLFEEVKNVHAQAVCLGDLMLVAKEMGRPRVAITLGKRAVNAFQETRSRVHALDLQTRQAFLASASEVYRVLADLLVGAGRIPEAQKVLGMLKEEEYFEFVSRDAGEAGALTARADLTAREAKAQGDVRAAGDRVTALGAERGTLRAKDPRTPDEEARLGKLEADLAAASAEFQAFLSRLEDELGPSGEGGERVRQLREAEGLQEDLRELGHGAVALYTMVGERSYRVILVTPDAQRAGESPVGAAELNRKVLAFREALRSPAVDPRPLARELYGILLGPVAADLEAARAETLMWSLDGALRYLPVAALHDGERYVVERWRSVVFTPASNARLRAGLGQPPARWTALGLGVSEAVGGFNALPAVPAELRAVVRDPGGGAEGVLPGVVMLDRDFTKDRLLQELRRRFPVVHIASHFQFRPGREAESYLLLGDGAKLDLREVKALPNLFSGVELLALSACDTATGGAGDGKEGDGREVEGFGVLAQRKGARAVLATLWPVADESTRLVMSTFYRERQAHPERSKAEALRRAQLSLLRPGAAGGAAAPEGGERGIRAATDPAGGGAPRYERDPAAPMAHPYFWAPFILIGNWL